MIYSRETLEDVKKKINILDLADKLGIEVSQNGNVYQARCKHEGDNTPSLTFYPDTQTYYCFGCGATGDIIRFVSWYLDVSFPKAVQYLAELYNLTIDTDLQSRENWLASKLVVRNRDYWKELSKNQEALEYLASRNIDLEDTKKWRIGLIPQNTGVQYAGRLVFGILNEYSDTVGFAYRALNNDKPKYINSADSELFKKSHILYGFNYVRELVKEKKYLVLVEGYTDVIQLQKWGIPAIGLMGTNLSKHQIDLIKTVTDQVIVFLDADVPGITATEKVVTALKANNITNKVMIGHTQDPDELAIEKKAETESFIKETAVLWESYKIQSAIAEHKMHIDDVNIKFLNKVFPLLASITNSIELEYQISIVSSSCGIDKSFIYRMLTKGGYYEQATGRN